MASDLKRVQTAIRAALSAAQNAKDGTDAAKAVGARGQGAVAVAVAVTEGVGRNTYVSLAKDERAAMHLSVPANRVSEALGVFFGTRKSKAHPDAAEIAAEWAVGDFEAHPVAETLKAMKTPVTPADVLSKAVRKALADGMDADAVRTAVTLALASA